MIIQLTLKSVYCVHRESSDNIRYTYLFPDFILRKRFQQQCNHKICTTTFFLL